MVRKLMALSLCLLLGSCSATRPMVAGSSGPRDLSRYVLVIKNTADGQATYAWKPAKDFDPTEYRNLASVRTDEGRIVRVSLDAAECERQYDICVPECQASTRIHQVDKYIYDTRQYGPWRTGKWSYCRTACMRQLANCLGEAGREPVKFEAIDTAVDWLKRHQDELALGAVVVIAGVVFYVAACSGGILLLAPALLFAEVPQ
ncbi:hypothetical protein [Archangium violaceum]|uniref:hypothetical protein n=1 Tax=Archangium violaceum TaxID=83451 RepID=UPI001EEFAB4B|nr:hypothetical protein [Archangium violaceum]